MRTTTFYSYKGGLGRSLIVAWAARALERAGRKVVALDLDLEAPGLAFKLGFHQSDDLGPGFVGLLNRFQNGDPPPESLVPYLRAVPGSERLWFLPAGPLVSAEYWRSLASLSWERLFFDSEPQGVRFFRWLRESIEREFAPDHLLIDARTGVTEMGGAALSLMADQILALLGTAEEGIHGTREVLRGVAAGPRARGKKAPRMGLNLARMPADWPADELQRLRGAVRDKLREEADPLSASIDLELPIVVRSEPLLQGDENLALSARQLRVHEDYRAVLSWIEGGAVPQEAPGVHLPREASTGELRRSIELQRELAEAQPEEYLPDLAIALGNLASMLASLGRREEALVSAEEATEIYRRLARSRPDEFEPELASSLSTLANVQGDLGRREEALASAGEATRNYRRLAIARPDAYGPDLALSLNNLGNRQSELGRREEALASAEEAAGIRRRLAIARPEAYEPDLAMTLSNLGMMQSMLGRRQEALASAEEAVEIHRRLARTSPDVFEPNLAMSLNNLGTIQSELGSDRDALARAEEATEIRRRLAHKHPDAFELDLSISLSNLGVMQSKLGRSEEALASAEEALRVLARQFSVRPHALENEARRMVRSYLKRCSELSRSPDAQLLRAFPSPE